MSSTARTALLCLSLFFILLPLAVAVPGMPTTLKADEPAYYLMAQSLARDGDFLCETKDLRRLFDRYPHLPIENLILMSDDGWQTAQYGKPYLYSLLATPWVALFDDRGMVSFNMLLLMAMVWAGYRYLRRFNDHGTSALFSAAFFLLAPTFVYAFWLQPEILNMFSVVACCYFGLTESDREADDRRRPAWLTRLFSCSASRAALSGLALAPAVYNKPMLALLGIPALLAVLRRRGLRAAVVWVVAAAISLGTIAGFSTLFTGHPTPYLGTARGGVKVEDPEKLDEMLGPFRRAAQVVREEKEPLNSFQWMFRIPKIRPKMLAENVGYFLWGRHTGFLLYMPFAVVALALFFLARRKAIERWAMLASLAGVAVFLLLWIFFNWHGGAGFVGNRYYANAYPAFLFLVTTIRPRWLLPAGFAAAALLVGPTLLTPYGAAVPEPTLQAHARSPIFETFPLELSVRSNVPGYTVMRSGGVTFQGRRDLVRAADRRRGVLWLRGAFDTELWALSARPLDRLAFSVQSLATDNRVTFTTSNDRQRVAFEVGDDPATTKTVAIDAGEPRISRDHFGKLTYAYRVSVFATRGRNPRHPDGQFVDPPFYLGAALSYLQDAR